MSDAPENRVSPELAAMPPEELRQLADSIGVESARYATPLRLALAVQLRRDAITNMDGQALLELMRWARRPVSPSADKMTMAREIASIKSMRFEGLSPQALAILAVLRGVEVDAADTPEQLIRKLRKQEGLFARIARQKRRWLGSIVSNMLGEGELAAPDADASTSKTPVGAPPPGAIDVSRPGTLQDEIEEAGLLGGLAGRIKRTADGYIKEKLDEIETRIDKKLDEIDQRLAEWRDKEVANRLRIIKITLWASLIVAAISLIYSFIKVYLVPLFAT